METKIIVKSVLGTVCGIHTTKKDITKFSVFNGIKTKMQWIYGPKIFLEFEKKGKK